MKTKIISIFGVLILTIVLVSAYAVHVASHNVVGTISLSDPISPTKLVNRYSYNPGTNPTCNNILIENTGAPVNVTLDFDYGEGSIPPLCGSFTLTSPFNYTLQTGSNAISTCVTCTSSCFGGCNMYQNITVIR